MTLEEFTINCLEMTDTQSYHFNFISPKRKFVVISEVFFNKLLLKQTKMNPPYTDII